MRTQLTGAAIAALLIAAPAAAQGRSAFSTKAPVVAPSVTFDAARVERARQLLDSAERRWFDYDLKGARKDFARATEILKEQHIYAGPALVSLAHVTYASQTPDAAARVLLDAASEAARFGDLELQVTALYDASLLYTEARDYRQAKALFVEAKRLLASAHLPQDVKAHLERRMLLGE